MTLWWTSLSINFVCVSVGIFGLRTWKCNCWAKGRGLLSNTFFLLKQVIHVYCSIFTPCGNGKAESESLPSAFSRKRVPAWGERLFSGAVLVAVSVAPPHTGTATPQPCSCVQYTRSLQTFAALIELFLFFKVALLTLYSFELLVVFCVDHFDLLSELS